MGHKVLADDDRREFGARRLQQRDDDEVHDHIGQDAKHQAGNQPPVRQYFPASGQQKKIAAATMVMAWWNAAPSATVFEPPLNARCPRRTDAMNWNPCAGWPSKIIVAAKRFRVPTTRPQENDRRYWRSHCDVDWPGALQYARTDQVVGGASQPSRMRVLFLPRRHPARNRFAGL